MESAFRLRRIVGGVPHVADVAVRVESFTHDAVAVSEGVFAWRRKVYGPGAVSGGPIDQQMVAEAVEGVRYVLGRRDGDGRLVTVTRICDAPADTGVGDVKFAAVAATCQALGVELDRPPFIGASGVVFPD
ncbi:hypothetical protein ACLQ28_20090 [Micromonospora sp. DT201]|uniref:hypothetical protein n=1 Tax=Micromonospora sp. DT201 TaxID=3393442 RepID=UPI003CE8BA92